MARLGRRQPNRPIVQRGFHGEPPGPITRRILTDFAVASGASSATSHSITPTGQQENDWLVIFVATVGGTATHANSAGGLTEVGTQVTQATTTTVSLWKKKCAAGESGTTYTWTVATGRRWAAIATCWTGADPTDVVDGSNVSSEGATAQQLDHNTLTPGAAFDWHIIGTASNTAAPDDAAVSFTQPGGYEELAEIASGSATLANARASLAVKELPDTSATGVQSVTITGGVDRALAGFEVVIRVPAGGAEQKTLADTGAGADSLQVSAAATLADAGSGADALSVAAAVPLADAGIGADSVQVALAITLPDSGTAADALQVAATATLADSGAGTDALTVAAAVTLPENGAGADSLQIAVPKTLGEVGAGADALTVAAAVTLVEAGAGSDALQVAAAVTLTQSGSATDSISVSSAEPKILTDAGTATDALTVIAAVPLADSGAGADQLAVAQTRTLSDTGTATDAPAVSQAKTLADNGIAGDVLRIAATLDLSDLGAAAENAAAAILLALADSSTGADALDVATVIPVFWAVGVAAIQPAATGEAAVQPQTVGTATLQLAAVGEGSQQ